MSDLLLPLPRTAGELRSRADGVVIDNPRALEIRTAIDVLVEHGACQGDGAKRCLLIVGPSQLGKTVVLNDVEGRGNSVDTLKQGLIPVLNVSLRPWVTTKGLVQTILDRVRSFGYSVSDAGTEAQLIGRMHKLLRAAQTQVLILDEFHHVNNIENQKVAWDVGETIKTFLLEGSCPVVMSGIEAAKEPFLRNQQLAQRSEPAIELRPLRADHPDDRALFLTFLRKFLSEIERVSGFINLFSLFEPEAVAAIHEISHGVLGRSCNLLKATMQIAFQERRTYITLDDLARAAQRSFVDLGLHHRNPFEKGLSPLTGVRGQP